jgi:hypothetical protein
MERVHPLALNGTGYDDALHALQEQFPYYIHGVNFTPWTDAVGMADQAHRNTPDTGYVIPRHNRPEKAESGYFSTDVFGQVGATGSGKVKAHTTRYQNRRAHQNGPVAAQQNISPVRGAAGSNGTPAAAAPPSPFGPRIAANAGPPAQATTEEGMDAQYSADMDLLDHLHDQQTFKSGAKVFMDPDPNKGHGDMSGANIRQEIEGQQFPSWGDYPAFRDFYRADKGALQAALANPQTAPQVRGVMVKVVRLANGPGSPINIDPAFVSRFHAGGQAEAAKDLPENLQLRIAEMHHDHVFPDADPIAFYEHQQPTVEHISDTYVDDPLISALVDKGALPTNVDSAHFINQASAVEGEVRAGVERLYRQDRNGGQNTATRQALNDETEGLMRARQLRRRWEKARNRVGAPAPVWEEPAPIIQAVFPAGTPNTPEGMAPYRPQLEAASEAWQRQQRP